MITKVSGPRQKNISINTFGIFVFLATLTFLPSIPNGRMFGNLFIPLWVVPLVISWSYCIAKNKKELTSPIIITFTAFFALEITRSNFTNANTVKVIQDYLYIFCGIMTYSISKNLKVSHLKRLNLYFTSALFISSCLILFVHISKNYELFNGTGYLRALGSNALTSRDLRVVTPTYIPALLYFTWFLIFRMGSKIRNYFAMKIGFISSATVLYISSARGVLLYLLTTVIVWLLMYRFRVELKIKVLLITATSIFALLGSLTNFFSVLFSSQNPRLARLVDFEKDEWRNSENISAFQAFFDNFLIGTGFGTPYRTDIAIWGGNWLNNNAGFYVHNVYLWLLVKVGFIGATFLILSLIWEYQSLPKGPKNQKSSHENFKNVHVQIKILIIALLPFGLSWNFIANVPDILFISALIGFLKKTRVSVKTECKS